MKTTPIKPYFCGNSFLNDTPKHHTSGNYEKYTFATINFALPGIARTRLHTLTARTHRMADTHQRNETVDTLVVDG